MKMRTAASFLLVAPLLVAVAAPAQDSTAPHEIQMTAKKYEFDPSVVTVKKGEHVKLVITATDRDHGFKLDAFKINQHLKKGEPATVEFTADKSGEFNFHCSDFCGLGHPKMKGKVVVQE
jgi:cytochrome c oxidase subunit 2